MGNRSLVSDNRMSPRRVAYIHDTTAYGGVEILLLNLIKYLDCTRYQPVIFVPGYSEEWRGSPLRFIQQVEELGLPLVRMPIPEGKPLLRKLRQVIQTKRMYLDHKIDIVHIHTVKPTGGRIATVGAWFAGVKGVLRTEHTNPTASFTRLTPLLVKPTDWMTDRILTVSDINLEDQVRLIHRNRRKLYRSYPGIQVENFQRSRTTLEAKQCIGIDPNLPVVGTVGRLSPEKGQSALIDAAPRILREYGPVNFLLVGDGPLMEELQQHAAKRGVASAFHFVGFQPRPNCYIEAMDIAVLPSLSEGLPLTLIEFMAMGIPTVTSDLPCFREAFVDGESGLIAPQAEKDSLAEKLLLLLCQPQMAKKIGQNTQRLVSEKFSIQRLANDMMNLYDIVIRSGFTEK